MKTTNILTAIFIVMLLLIAGCSGQNPDDKVVVKKSVPAENKIITIEDAPAEEETEADETALPETQEQQAKTKTAPPTPRTPGKSTVTLQPTDLTYMGAFRLPDGDGTEEGGFEWGGSAMAYYPGGDSSSGSDGYPGSLFMTGNDVHQYVGEISIPAPSKSRELSELPTATVLQPLTDIRGEMFGYLEIPRAGLAYLPKQGSQDAGKLYFTWGQHMQELDDGASHGWFDTDLSDPNTAGPWKIRDQIKYATTDYIFNIDPAWAAENTPGMLLATGRFRDGGQGTQGPSLIAYGPWTQGNPPTPGTEINSIPLLRYISVYEEDQQNMHKLRGYSHADDWAGGAWMNLNGKSAVVFAGIKGKGDTWYGYQDGTASPTDGTEFTGDPSYTNGEHGERGWWADSFEAEMIFYNPDELVKVAREEKMPYEPQPFATKVIDDVLFRQPSTEKKSLGAVAYDSRNGILYVTEMRGDSENDRPVVHVWKVKQ